MDENFQREGSKSNAYVGSEFEKLAMKIFHDLGVPVVKNFPVDVGVGNKKKTHKFDLGTDEPLVLVECKSHKWTKGNNVPSAKITVWNEAMYYFHCSPDKYKKIFFVLCDKRGNTGETLTNYYIRNYSHLIPSNVEIWEYNETTASHEVVYSS